jgi:two-component SAPR family response regulator
MISTTSPKVVIVDKEGSIFEMIRTRFERLKKEVALKRAKSFNSALDVIKKTNPDLIITNIDKGFSNGFELIKIVNDCDNCKSKFILLTDQGCPELANDKDFLNSLGVTQYLLKSKCTNDKIIKVILKELEQ